MREIPETRLLVVAVRSFRIDERSQSHVVESVALQQLKNVLFRAVTVGRAPRFRGLSPSDIGADHEDVFRRARTRARARGASHARGCLDVASGSGCGHSTTHAAASCRSRGGRGTDAAAVSGSPGHPSTGSARKRVQSRRPAPCPHCRLRRRFQPRAPCLRQRQDQGSRRTQRANRCRCNTPAARRLPPAARAGLRRAPSDHSYL